MAKLKRNNNNNKPINISQVLVVKPQQHSALEIQSWVSAISSAYRGKRSKLVALYNNMLLDGVLHEAMDKRIRAITNANLIFQDNNGEENRLIWEELIDTAQFENLLREIMLSKFYGKSVIELDFTQGFKITSIDRRHLDTEKRQILLDQSSTEGISYEDNDFLLNVGDDKDLGLFARTSPHAIFKRNGGSDYAQFCELFGIPQLVGYYDPDDENGRVEMETAFKNRGSGASMTASNKSKIETIGSTINSSSTVHLDFINHCDKQILIAIQGQTMTTTDGTSLAQAKVHSQTMSDIERADRIFVRRFLNSELKPRLEKRGYPVANGWFNFVEESDSSDEKLKQLQIAERVHNLTEDGVDDAYFYEEFGLPRGKGKDKTEDNEQETEKEENTEEKTPKKKASIKDKRQKLSVRELNFWERLMDFFAHAPQ